MPAKKAKARAPKVEKKPWAPDPRGPQHILPKFLKKVQPRPPEERPPPRTVEPVQPPRRDLELPQGRRSVKEVLIAAGNGEYLKNIPVAWHGLPPEDVAQRMASWLEREEKSHRMRDFKPYPKQQEFFAATLNNREVALFGGNQCMTPWTVIQTAHGERRIEEMLGEEVFDVRSWDGDFRCVRRASSVFLKGIEPAFRVLMDNGESFECSYKHRLLTTEGWLSLGQLVQREGGWRCPDAGQDSWASYAEDGRLCGEELPWRSDSAAELLPSIIDVHTRSPLLVREDEAARRSSRIRACLESFPRTTFADDPSGLAALFSHFGTRSDEWHARLCVQNIQALRQSANASTLNRRDVLSELGLSDTADLYPWCLFSSASPILIGGNKILAVMGTGHQPIVDFEVQGTHCYQTAGVVHHNSGKTYSAAMLVAFHATGNYPEDFPGHRFKKAPRMWVASLNYEFMRDNSQKHIVGSPEEIGCGALPFKSIIKIVKRPGVQDAIDSVTVRHITGGVSRIKFKSYEEGPAGFQGETIDFYWADEEMKDYSIYTEMLTRISATKGRGVMTFTPLLGATNTVDRFMKEKVPGTHYVTMTIHDALHYTEAEREMIIAGWPAHERRARELGLPNQGTGTVFSSIDPEFIKYENIPVQDHWYRIAGMDFGLKDPTVLAYIAHDREADIYYLYDLYYKADSYPPEHYQAWKSRGDNIPVAWPADGLKRGPADGVQLAAEYERLGMKMLDEPALLPEVEDKKDGSLKVARNSVEAGLRILLALMSEGRFKVAAHLEEFWNEFRLYYRDKNGKLVDANNHVIDAIRMAISMELQGFGEQGTRSTPYHYHKRQGGYRSRYG